MNCGRGQMKACTLTGNAMKRAPWKNLDIITLFNHSYAEQNTPEPTLSARETQTRKREMAKILAAFPGSRPVKYHGNMFSENGVADTLICIAPYGLYVAIEWKRDAKGKPEPLQERFLYQINQAGGLGICTHDAAEAIEAIRQHIRKVEKRFVHVPTKRRKARKKT